MENWTVKSVDGVDVNAPKEEAPIAEEQQAAMEGPKAPDDDVIKVDLSNPPKQEEENEQQVSDEQQDEQPEEPNSETEESSEPESPLELISEEEPQKEDLNEETLQQVSQESDTPSQESIPEAQAPQVNLPEGVEKLVQFMEETGGNLEDYVNLNKDLNDYSDEDLLFEYYKQTKGWESDEIREHISDSFAYDEELDDPKDIRAMKREFKSELRSAKKYLEGNREQYYNDLKLRPRQDVDPAYQEAYDFHNSYKESQEASKQLQQTFIDKTNEVFNQDFKGFDFKVGENTYRYKVNEPAKVKEYQSDINNFVKEFLGEDGSIKDAKGYHKAMYAAKNVDKLAQHFYEQGRAEALKQQAAEAKNINMDPRKDASSQVVTKSGTKVRVVDSGFDSKLKIRNFRNR